MTHTYRHWHIRIYRNRGSRASWRIYASYYDEKHARDVADKTPQSIVEMCEKSNCKIDKSAMS